MNPHDRMEDEEFEAFLKGEGDLARQLREVSQPLPPEVLSAAILARAEAAAQSRVPANDAVHDGRPASPPARHYLRRARVPLGLAASVMVALFVARGLMPQAFAPAHVPEAAPAKMVADATPVPQPVPVPVPVPPTPASSADALIIAQRTASAAKRESAAQAKQSPVVAASQPDAEPLVAAKLSHPEPPVAAPPPPPPALLSPPGPTIAAASSPAAAPLAAAAPVPALIADAETRASALATAARADKSISIVGSAVQRSVEGQGNPVFARTQIAAPAPVVIAVPPPVPEAAMSYLPAPVAAASAPAALAGRVHTIEPPVIWLNRINDLLKTGHSREAITEWTAFRKRYPSYEVPPELRLQIEALN